MIESTTQRAQAGLEWDNESWEEGDDYSARNEYRSGQSKGARDASGKAA
jgi:hypothetical protein